VGGDGARYIGRFLRGGPLYYLVSAHIILNPILLVDGRFTLH
jgi:hypothetical protein